MNTYLARAMACGSDLIQKTLKVPSHTSLVPINRPLKVGWLGCSGPNLNQERRFEVDAAVPTTTALSYTMHIVVYFRAQKRSQQEVFMLWCKPCMLCTAAFADGFERAAYCAGTTTANKLTYSPSKPPTH